MKNLTDTEAAYIAGIIDGEGSIRIQKRNYISCGKEQITFVVQINVTNNNIDVLEFLKEKTGVGNVYIHTHPSENHRICYRFTISARIAHDLLKQIYPYMIIKKKHTEIAINYLRCMDNRKYRNAPRTDEETKIFYSFWKELNDLNKRVGHQKL